MPALKEYLIKILRLYLVWTVIYTPLEIMHDFEAGIPFVKGVYLYVKGLVFIGEHYNSWMLWYLLSAVYAVLAVMLLSELGVSVKGIFIFGVISGCLSLGLDCLAGYEGDGVPGMLNVMLGFTFGNGRILQGMAYIPAGIWLAHNELSVTKNMIMFLGGMSVRLYMPEGIAGGLCFMISAAGLFGLISGVRLGYSEIFGVLRRMSTVIFLVHMYIWTFYYTIRYDTKTSGLDSFIITSAVSVLAALVYVKKKPPQNLKGPDELLRH